MKTAPNPSSPKKPASDITAVTNLAIWGNHSATQYPDFTNAKINGQPATERHQGRSLAQGRVHATVQQRGAAIIKARGLSSAASAANAVVDTVASIVNPTPPATGTASPSAPTAATASKKGLICSFPVRSDGQKLEIVQGLTIDAFASAKIDATVAELKEEKSLVADLLPK